MIYKYQTEFAQELTDAWIDGKDTHVRTTIRNLKNKAQSAYIAGEVVYNLVQQVEIAEAARFVVFMHPDNA